MPDSVCYVIYTSGSTGQPKGVLVPHRATANFIPAMQRVPGIVADDVRPAVPTLSFDIALMQPMLPVRLGPAAVIAERRDASRGDSLSAVLSISFSQRPCAPVVEKFRHWPEISNYYSVTGPLDAYMVVRVNSAQDLSRLVDRLSALPGVGSVRSAVVLKADFG